MINEIETILKVLAAMGIIAAVMLVVFEIFKDRFK